MEMIRIGDRFKKGNNAYILCRVEGFYYLVNLKSGEMWTNGLTFEYLVNELVAEKFEKIY